VEILMDWQGSAARVLNLVPKQSQVLIFDAGGSLVFRGAGALTEAERARFFVALDAALGRES
jgi:predicted transcriptional regulator